MKKSVSISLCIVSFFLGIIINFNGDRKMENPKVSANENKMTYSNYEKLYEHITRNIEIDNFEVKANTLGDNITIIDKALSFNKREALTIDGAMDMNDVKPTDEQLTLESNDGKNQITISMIYTDSYIGNDFIAFPNNIGFDNLNKDLISKASVTAFTYKNLVFLVQQVSSDKYDTDIMNSVNTELIKLINSSEVK